MVIMSINDEDNVVVVSVRSQWYDDMDSCTAIIFPVVEQRWQRILDRLGHSLPDRQRYTRCESLLGFLVHRFMGRGTLPRLGM